MKSNDRVQNLTEYQLSAIVLPFESDDRFDQELVGWFALHLGAWSGTAPELLAAVKTRVDVSNDLWPQSPRALYAYMEAHKQIFRSLGVAILLPYGYPRMISLRSCQDEQPARKPPSGASGINETFSQQIPTAQSNADGDNPESVWENTAEALFAMLRKSDTPELTRLSTISKLAAVPTLLCTAFKRAWMRRTRAM
jgi:hypothetical protein